jgi:SAM-dependent methyltransferase
MPLAIPKSESRSFERIREHYLIERELAARLRAAGKDERRELYSKVYDELFRLVPDHPQLTAKVDRQTRDAEVSARLSLLRPYLHSQATYLELGPGDCSLAIAVARHARKVYAIDVSAEISAGVALPENVELAISDGRSVPVPGATVDVAYSDQLMEHLHPDDAAEQLANIYRALAPRGVYVCITPNRLSGPHDVSRYFEDVATGFHLKEYTVTELAQMFQATGFRKLKVLAGGGSFHVPVPGALVKTIERALTALPRRLGRMLASALPLRTVLGVKLVGIK